MEQHNKTVLVRLEEPERLYDREAVLGRDATSVFPTLTTKAAGLDWAAAGGASAAPQFVTEAELEELKAKRGGTVEDGTVSVDKPLYEVLRENKEKKEEEFQDKWRIMKQGKNKPLEAEEVEFLDSIAAHELETERRKRAEEAQELESFQLMREHALVKTTERRPAAPSFAAPQAAAQARPAPTSKLPKTIVRARPVGGAGPPSPKRARGDDETRAAPDNGASIALSGLAAYGSDSE